MARKCSHPRAVIAAARSGQSRLTLPSGAGHGEPLCPRNCCGVDAYWRAANYLSVGQIYLFDNPLLERAVAARAHQAPAARALGHHARPELHLRSSQSGHQGI